MLSKGQKIGSFEVIGLLGAGGMGSVYKAVDTGLGGDVAIKHINQQLAQDPAAKAAIKAAFEEEARLLRTLRHENIVAFYGYETVGSDIFLITEFVDGESIQKQLIKRMGTPQRNFSQQEVVDICIPILNALTYAHSKGVIHRDIKPGNIMYDGKKPVLIDFGISRNSAVSVHTQVLAASAHTPFFSPPEQVMPASPKSQGPRTDARSDIYALGVTIYEMMTGLATSIFPENSGSRYIKDTVNDLPMVSDEMAQLLLKATAVKQDQRFQSAAEMAVALQNLGTSSFIPPTGSGGPPNIPGISPSTTTLKSKFDIRRT